MSHMGICCCLLVMRCSSPAWTCSCVYCLSGLNPCFLDFSKQGPCCWAKPACWQSSHAELGTEASEADKPLYQRAFEPLQRIAMKAGVYVAFLATKQPARIRQVCMLALSSDTSFVRMRSHTHHRLNCWHSTAQHSMHELQQAGLQQRVLVLPLWVIVVTAGQHACSMPHSQCCRQAASCKAQLTVPS